jgi:lysophospholipase-3
VCIVFQEMRNWCLFYLFYLACCQHTLTHGASVDLGNLDSLIFNVDENRNTYEKVPKLKDTFTKYPIVLVPGDGGNQLFSKLNKTSAPHYFCQLKSNNYFLLWLNIEEITPYVIDCFVDNIRLVYDNVTKTTQNSPGVDVLVPDFGRPEPVEYLDTTKLSATSYYAAIADAFVKKYGYVRGLNIRGAPYDWRKAPNEMQEFYANFTKLIEETYYANNGTKILLLAHSMGNPVTLYFLNNYVNQAWKDKFLKSFVSLSGVWGGAIKTLRLMASGDNIDIIVVKPLNVRSYQRSAPSTAFLMPSDKFWAADEVIVSRPGRNYTVKDYKQFFEDLNFQTGFEMREDTKGLIYDLEPPNVELHCLYGVNMKTPEGFTYAKEKDWPDGQPAVVYGDGDGTVNLRSLHGYRRWLGKQPQPIYYKEFNGVEHVATLKYQPVIDYILQLLYT